MKDTRPLFDKFVDRKPSEWEDISEIPENAINEEMYRNLSNMVDAGLVIQVDASKFAPDDDFIPFDFVEKRIREFIAIVEPIGVFYIAPQGYGYARYAAKLPDDFYDEISS